jgi:hypothetical protein
VIRALGDGIILAVRRRIPMHIQLESAQDYGDVAEVFVNGVADVATVAPGVVRVSFYAKRRGTNGKEECRIVAYQLWSLHELAGALQVLNWTVNEMPGAKQAPRLVASAEMH